MRSVTKSSCVARLGGLLVLFVISGQMVVAQAQLQITTTTLPDGSLSAAYSQTLTATGGTTPYTWTLTGGALPGGLTLSGSVISGTPSATGSFSFNVEVTDKSSPQKSATAGLKINVPQKLQVPTQSLADGQVGASYSSAALTATGGTSPYNWSVASGSLPSGLSLSAGGVISGTPGSTGSSTFTVEATDSGNPAQSASQTLTLTINAATVTLSVPPATLPTGIVGVSYSKQLTATGASSPSWSVVSGALPAGISLTPAGVLTGTPTASGSFNFTAQAAISNPTQTAQQSFTLVVAPALTVATSSLPNAGVGTAYSQTLAAGGGNAPYTWSIVSGALPDGLTLSSTTGTITGTPGTAATFNFTVGVSDSSSPAQTATKALSITVQAGLTITTVSPLPLAVVGAFYSTTLTASVSSQLIWSVITGIAPPGLTVTSTGTLAGTPAVSGTFTFTVQASNGVQTGTKALQIVVNPALAFTTVPALPNATLSAPYSDTITVTGGLPPYTWTTLGPGVPPGLTLSGAGVLSGTPTSPGSFSFTVQVSDSFTPQQQVQSTFTILVATTVTITTTSLPNPIQNAAYSLQFQATGTSPFTWAVTSGTLPAGINLSAGGLLSGTPTVVGAQTFTVTVTDGRGATSTQSFTLTVDPPLAALSIPSLPATINPTQVTPIGLTLAAPHPSALTGELILSFTSSADVPSDDPATQFSTGSRSVNFSIPAGQTSATFTSPVMLLTGTVTGTVTFTANFDNGPQSVPVATTQVADIPPQFTNVTATVTATGVNVQIIGYAPARRVTTAQFSFVVKNGSNTQTVPLSEDVSAVFATWFQSTASTPFGAAFSFVQSFNVSGNTNTIQSVTVTLQNAQGSTASAVVPLQ